MDNMKLNSKTKRESSDPNEIPALYESIMTDFIGEKSEASSQLNEEGYYVELYAPGYDNNGVADISAKCL